MAAIPPLEALELLGHGPSASGPGGGWTMSKNLYFQCTKCGGFVSGDPADDGRCACGAMGKDPDAGRFGSWHGDGAIAVYRRRR